MSSIPNVPRSGRVLRPLTAMLLALVTMSGVAVSQSRNTANANAYLGLTPPGDTPVVFAPEIISRGNIHSRLEISPDGREMFWNTVDMKTFSTRILTVRLVDGKWSAPQTPSFALEGDTQGAVFSPDGKRLYFRRNTGAGWMAQYVERTADGWSAPRGGGFAPSGSASFAGSGRVYYSAGLPTKIWNSGIFSARYSADGLSDARPLDETINVANAIDYTPYVSPDEAFLLFSSNRPLIGDKEALFIHVTFRKSDGTWSLPRRISDIPARFPSLSPDGKYIFFCGDDGNFYWVDRTFIDRRRMEQPASAVLGIAAPAQDSFPRYLGQVAPDSMPRLFALPAHDGFFPGDRIAISPDGKEFYYSEVTITWSDYNIRSYKFADGKWNGPTDLFAGFLAPALSVDNTTMYLEKYNDARTCWQSKRLGAGWSAPGLCTELPDPKDKHYPQNTTSGRLYASSIGALNAVGGRDIATYLKADASGAYQSLGRPLNSPGNEGDFYVARDESFMVFGSPHRGGAGGGELFISFREGNGSWSDPRNLGAPINTPGFEFGPYVTDDKRFLFFSRSDGSSRIDVYWVRFDGLLGTLQKP